MLEHYLALQTYVVEASGWKSRARRATRQELGSPARSPGAAASGQQESPGSRLAARLASSGAAGSPANSAASSPSVGPGSAGSGSQSWLLRLFRFMLVSRFAPWAKRAPEREGVESETLVAVHDDALSLKESTAVPRASSAAPTWWLPSLPADARGCPATWAGAGIGGGFPMHCDSRQLGLERHRFEVTESLWAKTQGTLTGRFRFRSFTASGRQLAPAPEFVEPPAGDICRHVGCDFRSRFPQALREHEKNCKFRPQIHSMASGQVISALLAEKPSGLVVGEGEAVQEPLLAAVKEEPVEMPAEPAASSGAQLVDDDPDVQFVAERKRKVRKDGQVTGEAYTAQGPPKRALEERNTDHEQVFVVRIFGALDALA